MDVRNWKDIKDKTYGTVGTERRDRVEREAKSFAMGVLLREERKAAGLTQAQLAEKVGKKREFISRIERDGSNITLTTLFEIAEKGLGKTITIQMH